MSPLTGIDDPSLHGLGVAPGGIDLASFAAQLGVAADAVTFMLELPEDIQTHIATHFDPSGTKDGNVLGRLQGYVHSLCRRARLPLPQTMGAPPGPTGGVGVGAGFASVGAVVTPPHIGAAGGAAAYRGDWHEAANAITGVQHRPQIILPSQSPHAFHQAGPDLSDWEPAGVTPQVQDFVAQLGVDEQATVLLGALPGDMQATIMTGFDPSGTKDGNVWGRLLGYARGAWARRLRLSEHAAATIRGLPQAAQVHVITELDVRGAGNENLSSKVIQFASRLAGSWPSDGAQQPGPALTPGLQPAQQQQFKPSHVSQASAYGAGAGMIVGAGHGVVSDELVNFATNLSLDVNALDFLQALPEDLASTIMATFDPSGSKDGHAWGRLFAFVRRMWAKHVGFDQTTVDQLKPMPEEDQKRIMLEYVQKGSPPVQAPAHSGPTGYSVAPPAASNATAAVNQFAVAWGLDTNAEAFIARLPEPVRDAVIAGFDGSGTKDGNIWGRLLGFCRQSWVRSLGLDQETVNYLKSLPEDAQMVCLTTFDPSGTKDGNISGRLHGFMKKVLHSRGGSSALVAPSVAPSTALQVHLGGGAVGLPVGSPAPSLGGMACAGLADLGGLHPASSFGMGRTPEMEAFLHRCGLGEDAAQQLEPLPEDILAVVYNNFDPSGTKDGNVLGRLQGYVKTLCSRRGKRPPPPVGALPAATPWMGVPKRPRLL